ncbi:MAG: DUF2098 domain-containing protein [Methermicoccaceae archaeon]
MERIESTFDLYGTPLKRSSAVKYIGTGTTGKVKDIVEDDEGVWVVLDSNELLYKPEYMVYLKEGVKEKAEAEASYSLEELKRLQEERAERMQAAEADRGDVETGGG